LWDNRILPAALCNTCGSGDDGGHYCDGDSDGVGDSVSYGNSDGYGDGNSDYADDWHNDDC
jgi:hypothetical protein